MRGTHEFCHDRFNILAGKRAPMHVNPGRRLVERFEKRKPHQVIPVGMGEDKIKFKSFFTDELITQTTYTGSGIQDNQIIAFGSNFNTCGITTVFFKFTP